MANSTANRKSTALYNDVELDLGTIETISSVTPTAPTVNFPAYTPNRQTTSSETKHRPADAHDSALDPMPVRIKNKSKKAWRSLKKSMSCRWKRVFDGTRK